MLPEAQFVCIWYILAQSSTLIVGSQAKWCNYCHYGLQWINLGLNKISPIQQSAFKYGSMSNQALFNHKGPHCWVGWSRGWLILWNEIWFKHIFVLNITTSVSFSSIHEVNTFFYQMFPLHNLTHDWQWINNIYKYKLFNLTFVQGQKQILLPHDRHHCFVCGNLPGRFCICLIWFNPYSPVTNGQNQFTLQSLLIIN